VAWPALLLILLAAAVVWLQMYRDRRFELTAPAQQVLYVRSPAVMTRLALSYDAILADVYWIRTVQYYGGTRLSPNPNKNYDLLNPLLDLTTSLDPQFSVAYRFGAFFLAEHAPGGADRPDLAIRLLEKAMAANPERWEYPHDVGFVYYRRGDYPRAAEWFQRAADVPGSPNWLPPLVGVTLAAAGDVTASRVLWQNLLTNTDEEWLRQIARHRLLQLDAIDVIRQLNRVTAAYRARHGSPPSSWDALIRDGLLRGVPRDPADHAFVLDADSGTVTVADDSPMSPLPTERAP
jgi:tetratricopeptide (TPR) repeat protein